MTTNGLITCVANGTTSVVPSYLGLTTSVSVTTGILDAWAASAPLATALVSDFPGRDTTQANFRSNSRGLYANSSFSTEVSFDSTVLYGGFDTLANDRTVANANTQLIIPSHSSQTDIVYHVRRQVQTNTNDLVPGFSYTNFLTNGNGSKAILCGLAFDPASYGLEGGTEFETTPFQPGGGVYLCVQYHGGQPSYYLVASIYNLSSTLLSDSTSKAGVFGCKVGDEGFAGIWADYFIRAYLSSGGTVLNCEAYMATALSAPKQVATLALTMLSGSPPMPIYGLNNYFEPYFITPAVSRLAFHQVIDNAGHPNTALDFVHPVSAGGIGIGDHGNSIAIRTVNLEQYASDAAFQADAFSGFPVRGRYAGYGTVGTLQTTTDTPHNNKKFFRMAQPLNAVSATAGIHDDPFQTYNGEIWFKESCLFGPGWSNYGAGLARTTLTQNVTGSGTSQTVTIASSAAIVNHPLNGLIGYGTATAEQGTYTVGTNTLTGIFAQNHTTGDEVSEAQGPGFKITQANCAFNNGGTNVDARMELVGETIESYLSGNGSIFPFDTTYPSFSDIGAGGLSLFASDGMYRYTSMTSGSCTDFVTTPTGNAQGVSGRSGTRSGQTVELQFRGRVRLWLDADYGRFRCRIEHYIGLPGSAPYRFQFAEAFCTSSITSANISAMHYGENFNERVMAAQTLDRWDCECCDPNIASVGPDPYGVAAALSLAVPAAGTIGSATSPTSSSLTYPVTAPATGSTVLHAITEVYNGAVWVPNLTATAWTAGAGGTQNIVVSGLTTATNYTGKIRFRLVSSYGMGPAVVSTNGTTS